MSDPSAKPVLGSSVLGDAYEALATVQPEKLDAFWMPFSANRQFKKQPRLLASAAGMYYTDDRRPRDPRRHRRPVVLQRRPCPAAHHRSGQPPDRDHGFRADLPDGPSPALRAGRAPGRDRAGSAQACVLHQLRLGVGGYRAEDRAGLPARARRRPAHAPDRSREGLPRRRLRRHLGRRPGQQPQVLRPAAARAWTTFATPSTSSATRFSRGLPVHGAELADDLERLVQLHDASTIAAVIVEPISGSAGVVLPPVGYLQRLREICDQARHPADLRRGHHRLRPRRQGLRRATLRRDAGPDHHGQGPDQRLRADGRGVRVQPGARRLHAGPRGHDRPVPWLHLFRPSAGLRGGPGDAGHLRGGKPVREGDRAGPVLGGRPA